MVLNRTEHRELLRALRFEEAIPDELTDRFEQHIAACPKCQGVLKKTRQLKKRIVPMLNASHPAAEELLAYLTRDESVAAENAVSFDELKGHLQACALCQNRVKHLEGEIKEVENLMHNVAHEMAFEHDYRPPAAAHHSSTQKRKMSLPPMPRAMLPVAGACAVLLLLFTLSISLQPRSYAFANLNADRLDVLPITRGNSTSEINLLLTEGLINAGDYNKARTRILEISTSELSTEQSLRLQLCDLMLTLKSAHRSYVRLFPHFEKSAVRESVARMEAIFAAQATPAPGHEAYWGLAHYYSAKAYLMLDNESQAVSHLQDALRTAHQRRPEAETLLQALGRK